MSDWIKNCQSCNLGIDYDYQSLTFQIPGTVSSEVKRQTHGQGLRCHLSQLRPPADKTLIPRSRSVKSQVKALLSYWWRLFSLVSRSEDEASQHDDPQRSRTYMVLLQHWGHVGRMASQCRLHLNSSRWGNIRNCCLLIKANNMNFLSALYRFWVIFWSVMWDKEREKTRGFHYSWFILSELRCLVC